MRWYCRPYQPICQVLQQQHYWLIFWREIQERDIKTSTLLEKLKQLINTLTSQTPNLPITWLDLLKKKVKRDEEKLIKTKLQKMRRDLDDYNNKNFQWKTKNPTSVPLMQISFPPSFQPFEPYHSVPRPHHYPHSISKNHRPTGLPPINDSQPPLEHYLHSPQPKPKRHRKPKRTSQANHIGQLEPNSTVSTDTIPNTTTVDTTNPNILSLEKINPPFSVEPSSIHNTASCGTSSTQSSTESPNVSMNSLGHTTRDGAPPQSQNGRHTDPSISVTDQSFFSPNLPTCPKKEMKRGRDTKPKEKIAKL